MSNADWHKLLHKKELTRKEFLTLSALAFISIFGVVGVIKELLSRAATPYVSGDAGSGTTGGTTTLSPSTGAISGEVVEFGGSGGPSAPTLESAVQNGTNTVLLTFTASTGAVGYGVNRDGVNLGSGEPNTTWEDPDCPDGTHTYTVYGVNSAGQSGPNSNTVSVTVTASSGGGGDGSTTPVYAPPGGVGSLKFNSDFSTMANQSGAGSQWGIINGPCDSVTSVASNVNIVSGQLVLNLSSTSEGGAVTTNPPGWKFTAPSDGGFTFTYGYVECSFVVPQGGWWAVWLDGEDWPGDGEFDICENLLGPVGMTTNYWYGSGSGTGVRVGNWSPQPSAGQTVTVGGLWQPGSVTTYLNGVQMAHAAASYVSSDPQFLLLNMGYNSSTSSPGDQLKVNWIRVWALP